MSDLPRETEILLLDADGNLFPSEEPAFVASAAVTNRFLGSLGVDAHYTAEYLLATTTGRNFRTTAVDLARAHGVALDASFGSAADASGAASGATLSADALDHWVNEEKKVVSAYLGEVLRPDPAVLGPLRRLAARYPLAAVSSSALFRLEICFRAAELDELIPAARRFSAEDSLPTPTSKPDPAIYRFAAERLGVAPERALAIEDSLAGTQSALAAGIPTVGNLMFVPPDERPGRRAELAAAGAARIIESWDELATALLDDAVTSPA